MSDVYVVDGCRTPMGRLGGQLSLVRPDDLAAHAIRRLLERNPDVDPRTIEDVQWGAANQAGEDNRNVGRMAGLLAGLPIEIPGATVNRLCGSGMQAVVSASHALGAGWGDVMIAGGSESMSRAPYVISKPEKGFSTGMPDSADTVLGWRLVNPEMERLYTPITLGMTAEVVADKYDVSREDQDVFALSSHRKAVAAVEAGRLAAEIEPIEAPKDPRRRSFALIESDEGPRADTSLEALGKLPPVFKEGGTVTAGNSSPMNDGAAALLLTTESGLERHGLTPLARIVSTAAAGVHPDVMGIGPVPASEKALQRAGIGVDDLDLVEVNEAFAAQAMATVRLLGLDPDKVNVNGGAIALGHPLGASGARILVTLIHELVRRQGRFGLATMCIGVGQGISTVVERV
ncbi:MAG TPA: thiolase family protein [Acidimicrobiia bacterium]|jgi:3-oxoadipyl-CoA thiolase|nr:thiolase family protein [Acidimicrobiia bacterium]